MLRPAACAHEERVCRSRQTLALLVRAQVLHAARLTSPAGMQICRWRRSQTWRVDLTIEFGHWPNTVWQKVINITKNHFQIGISRVIPWKSLSFPEISRVQILWYQKLRKVLIECFRGRHRGGGNFTSCLRLSAPFFHAAKWALSPLKLAPPWREPPEAPLEVPLREEIFVTIWCERVRFDFREYIFKHQPWSSFLCCFGFPCFSLFKAILAFLNVFCFFSQDFRGSPARKNPCCFCGFFVIFPKRQGKEDQGIGNGPNTVSVSTVSNTELSEFFWAHWVGEIQKGTAGRGREKKISRQFATNRGPLGPASRPQPLPLKPQAHQIHSIKGYQRLMAQAGRSGCNPEAPMDTQPAGGRPGPAGELSWAWGVASLLARQVWDHPPWPCLPIRHEPVPGLSCPGHRTTMWPHPPGGQEMPTHSGSLRQACCLLH